MRSARTPREALWAARFASSAACARSAGDLAGAPAYQVPVAPAASTAQHGCGHRQGRGAAPHAAAESARGQCAARLSRSGIALHSMGLVHTTQQQAWPLLLLRFKGQFNTLNCMGVHMQVEINQSHTWWAMDCLWCDAQGRALAALMPPVPVM